jgi:hypothetical protein
MACRSKEAVDKTKTLLSLALLEVTNNVQVEEIFATPYLQ